MENAFPGFRNCVIDDMLTNNIIGGFINNSISSIPVLSTILEKYPIDDIKERAKTFSYTCTVPSGGIRCKSSGRLETYDPRIYLRPISPIVDMNLPPDDMYASLIKSCKIMAGMFNYKYMQRHIIDKPEDYYVYMVDLPENFPVYRDTAYDKPSVYTENNITPDHVTRIGFIEFNKLDKTKP